MYLFRQVGFIPSKVARAYALRNALLNQVHSLASFCKDCMDDANKHRDGELAYLSRRKKSIAEA